METVISTVRFMRKQAKDCATLPIHYQVEILVNCWNWLTAPYRPMTDKEHVVCKHLARRIRKELSTCPYWHESDSGRLWYDGQRIPLEKQCRN